MAKAFLCDIASIPEAIGYVKGHLEEENHARMSGSCIMLMISCLYLAHVFCIEVTFSMVLPVMFMLLLLSMAAPGVPGSMVIMLATALPLLGVPAEATGLVVCFSALVGMLMVPVNSMGDAVTAVIVSKGRSGKE